MYIKKQKRKNGRLYLSVAHNYRDAQGKTRSKHIKSLGYLDELQKHYADPLAHFQAEIDAENEGRSAGDKPAEILISPSATIVPNQDNLLDLGAAIPSAYFYGDLRIGEFFENRRRTRGFSYDPCRILELLVWHRLSGPHSILEAWHFKDRFPRACNFSLDDVWASCKYLSRYADALVWHMNAALEKSQRPFDYSSVFYLVTDYYFATEENTDVYKTKEKPSHRLHPVVQMGLLTDHGGMPLDYEVFFDKQNDLTTMLPSKGTSGLRGKDYPRSQRVIMVADIGFDVGVVASCVLDGNGFIFSSEAHSLSQELIGWVKEESGYRKIDHLTHFAKHRVLKKTLPIMGADGRNRLTEIYVKEVALWSEADRTSLRYYRSHAIDRPQVSTQGWPIQEGRIFEDEEIDGFCYLVTSEVEMSDQDILKAYCNLCQTQASFCALEDDFKTCPKTIFAEDYIRTHFLVCYVCATISHLLQKDTSWAFSEVDIKRALANICGRLIDTNLYYFDYRSEISDALANAVGIDLSRRILKKSEIQGIMAQVRNS